MGKLNIEPILKTYTKISAQFGVVALELLKNCEQNVALLQDDPLTL